MSSDTVIQLESVGKTYRLYRKPSDRLWEALPFTRPRHESFQAVSNINLSIKRGEVVGIVGRNGAGKSTLLQLICGTLQPTSGKVSINGRIAALLELGAGFNPEFTGRENVWMNAAILGMSHTEIAERYDDIVAFSEIGDAIAHPVKTYSSGMFVRLAFAVAIHVSPDILVIDEALSVGDGAFAKKSFDRIMQLKASGCTILFCSHSLYQVEAICNRAIWIEAGQCRASGDTKQVTAAYQDFLGELDRQRLQNESDATSAVPTTGPQHAVTKVTLAGYYSQSETDTPVFRHGVDDWTLHLTVSVSPDLPPPTLGVIVYASSGIEVCSFSSHLDGVVLNNGENHLSMTVPKLPLLKGSYHVDVFILCEQAIHVYGHLQCLTPFQVTQTHLEIGLVRLDRRWQLDGNDDN